MAEYIDREALIEKLRTMPIPKQAGRANTWLDNCAAGVNAAIWEVASFPAADVAPVVRCKNCTHYDLGVCLKIYSDGNAQKDSWQSRNPDDFCSYGAMMDGGADHDA